MAGLRLSIANEYTATDATTTCINGLLCPTNRRLKIQRILIQGGGGNTKSYWWIGKTADASVVTGGTINKLNLFDPETPQTTESYAHATVADTSVTLSTQLMIVGAGVAGAIDRDIIFPVGSEIILNEAEKFVVMYKNASGGSQQVACTLQFEE